MLRPRICYVLSLLRIHSPDCEHCMAHLTCGDELRERLAELNELAEPAVATEREPHKVRALLELMANIRD